MSQKKEKQNRWKKRAEIRIKKMMRELEEEAIADFLNNRSSDSQQSMSGLMQGNAENLKKIE